MQLRILKGWEQASRSKASEALTGASNIISLVPIKPLIEFPVAIVEAIRASVTELTVTTDPAKPSTPSIKLTALEIPTIQRIVIGYENRPKSIAPPKGLKIVSILTPKRYTIVAIDN